jgi:hypothetical protein
MSRSRLKRIRRLTQRDATWLCCTRRAYLWITPKDGASSHRPYTTLVMDRDREVIRKIQVHGPEPPTPDQVLEVLHEAMLKPILGSGGRGRPTLILLQDAEMAQALAPRLAEIGVRCSHRTPLPLMDTWFPRMTRGSLKAQDPTPGLMSVPGVTEPMLRDLFAAAAIYYRQAPWRWIENWEPIEVRYPAKSSPRYLLVLGSGGEYFGLSLYESLDDVRVVLSHHDPDQTHELIPWMSVIFEEASIMAFEDLDALEKYGWPVAGEKAYPWVFKTVPHSDPRLPGRSDLALLAAAMRVLPFFVTHRLKANQGRPSPAEAIYALSGVHGGQDIALSYPVSLIDPEEEALEEYIEDWHWDEPSHQFARQVGKFLFAFMDHLATTGLAESTLRKHESNCWAIGLLECEYGYHDTFSPQIFTGGPSFLYEFKRKFSDSKYAVTSYQATWRKLDRYARSVLEKTAS